MTDPTAVLPNPQPHAAPQRPLTADRTGWVWAAYLFLFALLLASFPARNTDVWANLTSGRDLASGQTAALSYTWLYDLGLYATHAVGGEFLAVFVKAALLGVVGVLLLLTGHSRRGWLVPVVCAGLAILALSPRVMLRPATVSYLLLAGVLWLQSRPQSGGRLPWLTVGLFLVWANTDRGFLYGLLVLAVIGVGRALDGGGRAAGVSLGKRLLPFALCVIAGLLNPAHRNGFPLPAEFAWVTDAAARAAVRTPFGKDYFDAVITSPAALAYYPLVLLGVLGFVLNPRGFRWERFLPWVLTAVLSGISDRAIPLFAVVGGPITARNLSDYFAHDTAPRLRLTGAVLLAVPAAVFLIAAWPGLLFGPPYEPRRWAFDLPAAPATTSDWLRQEKAAGRWPAETKTMHLIPHSVVPFRWFCPDDPAVNDPTLVEALARGQSVNGKMRAAGCSRLLVHHPDRERLSDAESDLFRQLLRVLLGDPHRWPLLHVSGDVAVFGWRDPDATTDLFPGGGLDLTAVRVPELEAGAVPTSGPPPEPHDWKARLTGWFRTPVQAQSIHRDQAALLLMMAESSTDSVVVRNGQSWGFEQIAALTAAAAAHANPMAAVTSTALRLTYIAPPIPRDGPPPAVTLAINQQLEAELAAKDAVYAGPAYAAVREARKATAEHPADPLAHAVLGEAYMLVRERTSERTWARVFPKLAELRQAQAAAALHRALELSPPPALQVRVHKLLARLYATNEFTDLAAKQYELSKRPYPGRPPAPPGGDELDRAFAALGKDLKERQDAYAKDSVQKKLLEKVAIARNLGLNGEALQLLLDSDVAAFGANGMRLELELLVRTGQPRQVLDWTDPEQRDAVGRQNYHWYRSLALAARGEYAEVDEELAAIAGGVKATTPDPVFLSRSLAFMVGKNLLGEAPTGTGLSDAVRQVLVRGEAYEGFGDIEARLKNLAEVSVLRGILAAEAGDLDRARVQLRAALDFSPEMQIGGGKPSGLVAEALLTRLLPIGKR